MNHRNQQVSAELSRALSKIIQQELPTDHYGLVTVTDVVVTTKLERATIFISALKHGRDATERLNNQKGAIKMKLHSAVRMRKIPQLHFEYDIGPEQAEKIEQLLD